MLNSLMLISTVFDAHLGHYSYKVCGIPYCKDVSFDNDLGNIDMDSLVVQNEYVFAQVSGSLVNQIKIYLLCEHTVYY